MAPATRLPPAAALASRAIGSTATRRAPPLAKKAAQCVGVSMADRCGTASETSRRRCPTSAGSRAGAEAKPASCACSIAEAPVAELLPVEHLRLEALARLGMDASRACAGCARRAGARHAERVDEVVDARADAPSAQAGLVQQRARQLHEWQLEQRRRSPQGRAVLDAPWVMMRHAELAQLLAKRAHLARVRRRARLQLLQVTVEGDAAG